MIKDHSKEYLEDKQPIGNVKYYNKDFINFFDSLLSRVREEYGDEYDDFGANSMGVMLVHLFAYAMDQLGWRLDRLVSDSYIGTVTTLDGITRLVEKFGYVPTSAVSASGRVKIVFREPITVGGYINKGTSFEGDNGLTYLVLEDVQVNVGAVEVELDIREGEIVSASYEADGSDYLRIQLGGLKEGTYLASDGLKVFVDGVLWRGVKNFSRDFNALEYIPIYTLDIPEIMFGDNAVAKKPKAGAEILVEYIITHGAAGNLGKDSIKSLSGDLVIGGVNQAGNILRIEQKEPIVGGRNPESLEEIRAHGVGYIASGNKAITLRDYKVLSESFVSSDLGAIAKAYIDVAYKEGVISNGTYEYISNMLNYINVFSSNIENVNKVIDGQKSIAESVYYKLKDRNYDVGIGVLSLYEFINTLYISFNFFKNQYDTITQGIENNHLNMKQLLSDSLLSVDILMKLCGTSDVTIANTLGSLRGYLTTLTQNNNDIGSKIEELNALSNKLEQHRDISFYLKDKYNEAIDELKGLIDNWKGVENDLRLYIDNIKNDLSNEWQNLRIYLSNYGDSCIANGVEVYALTRDAEGWYVGPSERLLRALEDYLEGINSLTDFVIVHSGYNYLVYPRINIHVVAYHNIEGSYLRDLIRQTIERHLKEKEAGDNLYSSELYDWLDSEITEVLDHVIDHIDIKILEPSDKIDSFGNLILESRNVISKPTIEIDIDWKS